MYLVYMEGERCGVGKPTWNGYANIRKGRETPREVVKYQDG
jgi:hypothetical protein